MKKVIIEMKGIEEVKVGGKKMRKMTCPICGQEMDLIYDGSTNEPKTRAGENLFCCPTHDSKFLTEYDILHFYDVEE